MTTYIKDCFEEYGEELTLKLKKAGFSNHQIIDFLPEAASNIALSNKNKETDYVINNLLLNESSYLLSAQHISQITHNQGLSSNQVIKGLRIISPLFLVSFLNNKPLNNTYTR